MMDSRTSDGHDELVDRAERFAARHLEPVAAELDRSAECPAPLLRALAGEGFLGLLAPADHGGGDVDLLHYLAVIRTFSGACAAVASIVNAHSLATFAIARHGTDDQQRAWLPGLAGGDVLGACALHEDGPVPATVPGALVASVRSGGHVLGGEKRFVRNAGMARTLVAFAANASATGSAGSNGPSVFVIDARRTGVTVGPRAEPMGLTACPVASLGFENVEVDAGALLGDEEAGIADHLLGVAAMMAAAQTVGIAAAAAEHAAGHARRRVQFHRPVAAFQAVQDLLAQVQGHCFLARQGLERAARLADAGKPFEVEAAMLASFLARHGSQMLIDCCQVEGGLGISETVPPGVPGSLPLARMFRDIVGTTLLDAPGDFPQGTVAASMAC